MKTAINFDCGFEGISDADFLHLIRSAGFNGFFPMFCGTDYIKSLIPAAEKEGLEFQSIHADFHGANKLWEKGDEGDAEVRRLSDCLDACALCYAPIMVMHAYIGFGEQKPNDTGISRLETLLDKAQKLGVKIAVENTEGQKYLEYIAEKLYGHPALGFCIDTGHEMCYNKSEDMIGLYGRKLICTHLNDNLGITGSDITWLDDAHMMLFDGKADWNGVAARLTNVGFDGYVTSELTTKNKPGRSTHDKYSGLSASEFLCIAHERAERFIGILENARKMQ